MKKILKKLIIPILIITMLVSTMPAFASNHEEALFQVESLDLFQREADGTVDWSKQITRAEFAGIIAKLTRQNSDGLAYVLKDVNATTPYAQDINTVILLGLMNGDHNGNFRPNDYISSAEATTVFIRLLGYNNTIEGKDYPQAVINKAIKIGLLDSVGTPAVFTRKDFALMLNNSFDICIMEASSFNANGSEYRVTDTTFGEIVFSDGDEEGAFYGKGIVKQTSMAFLEVQYTGLEKDEVIINGTIYRTGKTNATEFLGMEVQFFAKKCPDGVYELKGITPTDKNKLIRFDAEDFGVYKHETSISYRENNKLEKVSLDSETVLIKNFDTVMTPNQSMFEFENGEFILINNDADKAIDAILIYSYEEAIVSGVYNNVITLKEGFTVRDSRYLNLEEDSEELLFSVVDVDGKYIDVNTLSSGSVVSVASDRTGKIMRVVARADAMKTGVLNSVSDEEFEFDDAFYNNKYAGEYSIGKKYNYYLNFKNDVIYFELADEDEISKYGYVIEAEGGFGRSAEILFAVSKQVDFGIEIDDSNADDISEIPMLICQNDAVEAYELASKVKFNGTKYSETEILSKLNGDLIYEFKLNADGLISELNEPEYYAGSKYATFSYNVYDKCFGGAGTGFDGFAINEKTQIICIPTSADCDDDYMVKNVINLEGNTIGYYVRGFDFDERTKKCRLIVINREMNSDNIPGVTVLSSKMAIVNSTKTRIVDDEPVKEVELSVAGQVKNMTVADAAQDAIPVLKEGDMIFYEENYDGEIANVLKVRSVSALTSGFSISSSLAAGATEAYGKLAEIKYDEVDPINNLIVMHFIIDAGGNQVILNVPQRNKPPIYLYSGDGEIRNASVEEIVPGSDNVYVFMSDTKTVSAVVIVR